ncbi:hypothetical protein LPJ78_002094, partial [Coemansia sp. RSA 989]
GSITVSRMMRRANVVVKEIQQTVEQSMTSHKTCLKWCSWTSWRRPISPLGEAGGCVSERSIEWHSVLDINVLWRACLGFSALE